MFLWSPDIEAVLVAMSCFRHLCEEADIRCGVDEVSVHNFLPNYNTFMEFASVSNMMSTGESHESVKVTLYLNRRLIFVCEFFKQVEVLDFMLLWLFLKCLNY